MHEKKQPKIIYNVDLDGVKDEVTDACIREIVNGLLKIDNWRGVADDIAESLYSSLKLASFMTEDYGLTDAQREILTREVHKLVSVSVEKYADKIARDERTKRSILTVNGAIRTIIDRTLALISAEINRGAIIAANAVAADAKNDDYNKIELRYPKNGPDITVPTSGVFLSTNCVDFVRNSLIARKDMLEDRSSDPKPLQDVESAR